MKYQMSKSKSTLTCFWPPAEQWVPSGLYWNPGWSWALWDCEPVNSDNRTSWKNEMKTACSSNSERCCRTTCGQWTSSEVSSITNNTSSPSDSSSGSSSDSSSSAVHRISQYHSMKVCTSKVTTGAAALLKLSSSCSNYIPILKGAGLYV